MDGAAILAAVRAMVPSVRERSGEIESGRRVPDDLVDAMKAAGVFRMAMPRSWGGPEADLWTQVQIVEALAEADGSVGWYAMIGSDGGYYSGFLDDATGRALWPDLDAVTAGFITPVGRAVVDGDDYVVSGRWTFGSAGLHSRLLASGCIVVDGDQLRMGDDGMPDLIVALLPTDACEIHDTWHTAGLRGTASNDYSVEGYRVPARHTFRLLFGAPVRPGGGIYGANNLFLANMAGVPLGLAARAVDELRTVVATKRSPSGQALVDSPAATAAMARIEVALAAARGLVRDVMADVQQTLDGGETLSPHQRAMFRGCLIHAAETAKTVATEAFTVAGGGAVYAKNPFERILRDALTAGQHVVFQADVWSDAGRLLVGADPLGPLV